MKILILNAGSSSLKYQLIDMDGEKLLAKGLVERIGIEGSHINQKANGQVFDATAPMANHTEGIQWMLKALLDPEKGALKSMDEIGAVGHRVLHGGERFTASVLVNDEVKEAIKANIPLGPLHNPANLMGIDQREALRVMGKRLKATHVADNSGKLDDHILPFQGNVNWRSILPVLSEIGYEGDLTFEIHNSTSRLPDHLVDATAALCEQVGRYLLDLANDKIHNETYGHTC